MVTIWNFPKNGIHVKCFGKNFQERSKQLSFRKPSTSSLCFLFFLCQKFFILLYCLFQKIIGRRERVNFFFDISKVLITIIWLKIKIFILNDKSGLCFERLKVKNNLKHLWFSLLKLIPFSLLKFTNGKGQGIDVAKLLKM